MFKMKKKGFLFTFITIFMLFALVVLSYDFLQRNKNTQETISELGYSSRLNFMRENIVSDFFSMLDITLYEITRDENIIVKFSNFSTIRLESLYPGYLNIQKEFIENKYSNISNINILLQNYIPEFILYPYNTRFVIDNLHDPRHFFIYINDKDNFNGMEIDIIVNTTEDIYSIGIPINQSENSPYVKARVYTPEGSLIFDTKVNLDYDSDNFYFNPFYVAFNKSVYSAIFPGGHEINVLQNLTFSYGSFREVRQFGEPIQTVSTFNLNVVGLEAHISRLYLNFTATEDKAVLMTRGSALIR